MTQDLIESSLIQQLAALSFSGVSENEASKQLGISRYMVAKLKRSSEFSDLVKEIGDRAVEVALNAFRSKMEKLEPLAYAALESNLRDKKLDAVRIWGEFVGLKDKKVEEQKDASIQIIMPGAAPAPKDIEVKGEEV